MSDAHQESPPDVATMTWPQLLEAVVLNAEMGVYLRSQPGHDWQSGNIYTDRRNEIMDYLATCELLRPGDAS